MVRHYPTRETQRVLDSAGHMVMSTDMRHSDIPCEHARIHSLGGSMKVSEYSIITDQGPWMPTPAVCTFNLDEDIMTADPAAAWDTKSYRSESCVHIYQTLH
jgi:hypothetical protein